MRTADQCLDKAREMQLQALLCEGPDDGENFLDMARTWRRMACLAQMQDLYKVELAGRA